MSDLTKEHRLIAAIKEWTAESLIGDDCAVLPGQNLVTTDTLVDGTHFLFELVDAEDLGWKAVAVNISDIAAMAGRPRYIVVSLTLPAHFDESEIRKLYTGMMDCARQFRTRIVGGDLTRGPALTLSLTVFGDVHENGALLRSGAQAGDVVAVTGDFGASAAGLWLLQNEVAGFEHCNRAHMRPQPRLSQSWQLVENIGTRGALMDASDGLADAVTQIANLSGVSILVDPSAIPIHEETQQVAALAGANPIEWALYGGEDYELVACLSEASWVKLQEAAQKSFFRKIGTVATGTGAYLQDGAGKREAINLTRSYQHWQ